jgi:hypothetical protein
MRPGTSLLSSCGAGDNSVFTWAKAEKPLGIR